MGPSLRRWQPLAREAGPFVLGALFLVAFALRVRRTHELTYAFLIWNLILAAVPWTLSLGVGLAASRKRYALAGVLGVLWLLFFPNAPYVWSDFIHLAPRPPVPMWFDALLLASASLTGLAFGLVSLRRVHDVVERRAGPVAGWAFVLFACATAGVGIWLGRFGRWNSWDAVLHPGRVLEDVLAVAAAPLRHMRVVAVWLGFAGFVAATYVAGVLATAARREPSVG